MNAAAIEKIVRSIGERLHAINEDAPEMSGMDWASEHGWISQTEWEWAEERSKACVILQNAEVEQIETLRREHPHEMDEFLSAHIERLDRVLGELLSLSQKAKSSGIEFEMRFNLTLLPDLISCLKAWRDHAAPKHGPAWMWRLAFTICEECEQVIRRKNGKSPG